MLLQDVRYAWRSLTKSRGFTAIAVACLALGIGINTTIFSVVDGVMLQPYPYQDADRIAVLSGRNQRLHINRAGMSYPDYKDLRDQSTTVASLAAFGRRSLTISDGTSEPTRYDGSTVTWNLFELLGQPPAIGRSFGPGDDRPGAEPVVMLSHEVWQTRYSSDPGVVGRAISVNGRPHTIVGVMPPRFAFPDTQRLWVPLAEYGEKTSREERGLQIFARMKPGVSIDQVSTDMNAITTRLAAAYPANRDWSALVRPISAWMLPDQPKLIILMMMGAVTLVLLIACSNVANLLLARASVRHREISIRSALGAGRFRIVRQLLTEAIMIGLFSAPLGFVVAWAGLQLLNASIPPDSIPYFIHWSLDARSLAYTVAISIGTGIFFGVVPALQATGTSLQESLREGGRGATGERRAWVRNTLVVAQVGLALILLIGSSLFIRSFLNLQGAAAGFDTAPLMTMRFYLPGQVYEPNDAKARRVEDIVRRTEALPGVQAAFASNFVPFSGGGGGGDVIVEGKPVEKGQEIGISFIAATPHVRQTLGVTLLRGRDISDSEGATKSPVALINQTMAKRVWGDDDPIGRRFRLEGEGSARDWFTVVGIVADFRHYQGDSDDAIAPAAYVPYPFEPTLNTGISIRVAAGDPAAVSAAVREQIRLSDAALPVFQVSTMEDLRQRSFWQFRLFGVMFFLFGAIALVLASIGVYGVLSYSVSQRTQEIGVRVALGAERADVLRLVVGQGLKLAAIGIAVGIAGAFGVTPAARTVLYKVTPTDPLSFTVVAVFLLMVALTASYIPARRAMAVDPLSAMRNE
jgi:putative ABC transport system permease protein